VEAAAIADVLDSYYAMISAYCANSAVSMRPFASAIMDAARKLGIPLSIDHKAQRADEVVRSASAAVNAILLSQKRVVLPSVLGSGITPVYQRGRIASNWTRHCDQRGREAWTADVVWDEDYATAALFFDRYAVFDAKARRRQSHEHFEGIQRKDTAYARRLVPLLSRAGIDEEQYDSMLEAPRLLSEEVQHIFDRARVDEYKRRHPNMDDNQAVAGALLADTAVYFRRMQRELADPSLAYLGALSIAEFAGQIGGLIRLMTECIEKGEHATAYAHFLNYAHISECIRAASSQQGGLAFDGMSVQPCYALAAHRLFQDMPIDTHTAESTLDACFRQEKHPAYGALELLRGAYRKNIREE
jgi:hypothetical protein